MLINELPLEERPRELLAEKGADKLTNIQLLAILLRAGTKGVSVLTVAEQLYSKFGSLRGLVEARLNELTQIKGIGRDKAITLKAAFTLAKRMSEEVRREQPLLNSPDKIVEVIKDEFVDCTVETFWVVLLNTKKRLIRFEKIAQGVIDTVIIDPKEVFYPAIFSKASSIVIVHNHPSGDPTPSEGDIKTTRELTKAAKLLNVDLLDHIIMGFKTENKTDWYVSLRSLGYFC